MSLFGCTSASIAPEMNVRCPQLRTRSRYIISRSHMMTKSETEMLRRRWHSCFVCQCHIEGIGIQTPCGHYYDEECIINLFELACRDETYFPPNCCGLNISLAAVQSHLSADLVELFPEKEKEFSTQRRVYCANPRCSRFLGPRGGEGCQYFTCPSLDCNTRTCSRCTGKVMGTSHACKKADKLERAAISLSKSKGWVVCPGCQVRGLWDFFSLC